MKPAPNYCFNFYCFLINKNIHVVNDGQRTTDSVVAVAFVVL